MRRIIAKGDKEPRKLAADWQAGVDDLGTIARRLAGSQGEDRKRLRALEMMPEAVKLLYTKAVVAQALVDGEADPREVASVYVFASRIGLDAASRGEVRRCLSGGASEARGEVPGILGLTNEVLAGVR